MSLASLPLLLLWLLSYQSSTLYTSASAKLWSGAHPPVTSTPYSPQTTRTENSSRHDVPEVEPGIPEVTLKLTFCGFSALTRGVVNPSIGSEYTGRSMSREAVTRIVAVAMAVLLPATSLFAQAPAQTSASTPSAMLASQGDVSVNGKKVPSSIALFVGDRVQTGENSVGTLTAKDASVLIFSHTSLTYGGNYVEIGCGAIALNLDGNALSARVQNLIITPTSESSKIEITKSNGKLQIGARQGTLTVDDGAQKSQVETGKSLNFENAGDCSRKAAAVPPGAEGAPSPLHVSNALLYGIGAGVAGGVLLLILNAGSNNSPPASSSVP